MFVRRAARLWPFVLLLLSPGVRGAPAAGPAATTAGPAATTAGPARAHDPSRITRCGGKYYYYATGTDCPMHVSTDMRHWTVGPPVLHGVPAWMHQLVPAGRGDGVWAPDVILLHGTYYLFYCYSSFGSQTSVIGLVTSPTLDPASPKYGWTDRGLVVASGRNTGYNAIDPCPLLDTHGRLWLSFGSWFGGLRMVPLDTDTGKTDGPVVTTVGRRREGPEASYVHYHGGFYYLFENEGFCCRGVNSTYFVVMGRSRKITGPYLDKAGHDLGANVPVGGTVFLATHGSQIGPGQVGIYGEHGVDYLTYHYYSGDESGRPTLGQGRVVWGADGWPQAAPL